MEIVTFDVSGEISGIIVEGKIRPSRVGDDPNRPNVNNERKIQVTHPKQNHFNTYGKTIIQ